uniref:3',5'-cyclic-nucleotide phosphodiesterase n=1 Tax=Ditylenchus dipsaci TaxID=166011 RepID=A0A915ECU5_9BILA
MIGHEHFEEQLLLHRDDDMLIFSSPLQLNLLRSCTHIISDGTFKYAPNGVKQIYLENYRKVPYHNWTHGWTVAHAMFVFLLRDKEFRPLEKLGLFVAAICHDLDHRGKSNSYMKSMSTPLASIYSTSVMEHHHFNQTVTILQQDGHNILKSLHSEEYKEVLGLIKYCILATDLALFFPNKAKLNAIIKKETSTGKMIHTATAKPWKVQTETVKVIFEEFYEQGDAEKINGREPIPMMDRTKANELPQMQVGFMRGICVPCYETISGVIPDAEKLKERSLYNAGKWEELAEEQKKITAEAQQQSTNDATEENGS